MPRIRMAPEARSKQLLDAAYKIATKHKKGIRAVTRVAVAEATKTTDGLVNRYFAGRDGLREAVIRRAVDEKHVGLVAQAQDMDLLTWFGIQVPKALMQQASKLNRSAA